MVEVGGTRRGRDDSRRGIAVLRRPRVTLAAAAVLAVAFGAAQLPVASPVLASRATVANPPDAPRVASGQVIVSFEPGAAASHRADVERAAGGREIRALGTNAVLLSVPPGAEEAAVHTLRARGEVRYAEPDYVLHVTATPNDPSFINQWGDLNTGQTVNGITGTAGADDKATAAWNVTKGSRSIVIAEADTGVEYTHPDLAANIWSNPGGIGGCSSGTHGYNSVAGSCDPMDDDTSYNGHGTHVAGILGAVGNNGVGVTGVNWLTSILAVKWLDSTGSGTTSNFIRGLDWVVQARRAGVNIRVVNSSATYYGTAYSQALSDEIDVLGQNGILFVAAAGNTSDDNDNPALRRYPCGYDRPTELCVTASDQRDALPSWANHGATTVDLAAPGNNVYSTLRHGSYGYISGGSMASPQVAGAAALILSKQDMSTDALKADLLEGTDTVSSLKGLVRTGRLNICKAMPGCTTVTASSVPFPVTPPTATGLSAQGQTLQASTGGWDRSPTTYAYQWSRCSSAGSSCSSVSGATGATYLLGSADVGATLRVAVTANNSAGSAVSTSPPSAVVTATSTFGYTGIGGSSDGGTANWKRVVSYSVPASVSVTKLSVYLTRLNAGSQVLKGVIYADQKGNPGALLAVSKEMTFGSSASAGWYDMVFSSPVPLSAGGYWIGLIAGPSSQVVGLRYRSAGDASAVAPNDYTAGPSNPFGPPQFDSEQLSLYATYTTSSTSTTSTSTTSTTSTSTTSTSTTSTSTTSTTAPTSTTTVPKTTGTIGLTSVGGNNDTLLADRKRVNHYTLGVSASATKLSAYFLPTATSGQQVVQGLIYSDSGGVPGTLLGKTTTTTFTSSSSAGWYDLAFPAPVNLPAGTYWIGLITGNSNYVIGIRWNSVSGARAYNGNVFTSGPTGTFGAATIDSEQMSIYATYTS